MSKSVLSDLLDITLFDRSILSPTSTRQGDFSPIYFRNSEEDYEVILVSPGIPREELQIEVQGRHLTLSYDQKESKSKLYWPSFRWTWEVPKDVDPDRIEATYLDGVLTVKALKLSSIHSSRKITIE